MKGRKDLTIGNLPPVEVQVEEDQILNMDLTAYSSVGTQTPLEDRSFEFPECFSPSLQSSRSSVSSIGTQTSVRQRSYESPDVTAALRSSHRPKLFRRHSTGSDVYNFASSPTLMTAFGGIPFLRRGIFNSRLIPEDANASNGSVRKPDCDEPCDDDLEIVGKQLRKIGDDFDRVGSFRSRSMSVSRFLQNVRRRTSSSSS